MAGIFLSCWTTQNGLQKNNSWPQIKKGTLDPKSLPNPKDRWYPRVTPEEFERILLTDSTPTESDIHLAIEKQFQLVLRRSPTQSETKKYLQPRKIRSHTGQYQRAQAIINRSASGI